MEELIARVATAADIPADQAERAIDLVFAFLRRESSADVSGMLRAVPGAEDAANKGEQDQPKESGLMGGLMSAIGGGGGLMGLASQLSGIGLGTGEMTTVGHEIFTYAREMAGDEKVSEIAHSIPGLGQFL